jgi:hypothetical protein
MITSPLEQITMTIDFREQDLLTSHLPKRELCVNKGGPRGNLRLVQCLAVYIVEHMMITGIWRQTQTGVPVLDTFHILNILDLELFVDRSIGNLDLIASCRKWIKI